MGPEQSPDGGSRGLGPFTKLPEMVGGLNTFLRYSSFTYHIIRSMNNNKQLFVHVYLPYNYFNFDRKEGGGWVGLKAIHFNRYLAIHIFREL